MVAARYLILVAILALIGYIVYDSQFRDPAPATAPSAADAPADDEAPLDISPPPGDEPIPPSGFYKWTDANGVLHYTNEPESIPPAYRRQATNVTLPDINLEALREPYEPIPVRSSPAVARVASTGGPVLPLPDSAPSSDDDPGRAVRRSDQVRVYMTEWCDDCRKVAVLLRSMEVDFVELDVEKNVQALRAMLEVTGGKGKVPVLEAGKVLVMGYKPEAIILAVGKQKRR